MPRKNVTKKPTKINKEKGKEKTPNPLKNTKQKPSPRGTTFKNKSAVKLMNNAKLSAYACNNYGRRNILCYIDPERKKYSAEELLNFVTTFKRKPHYKKSSQIRYIDCIFSKEFIKDSYRENYYYSCKYSLFLFLSSFLEDKI